MSVVVTGGTGFIGTKVVEYLKSQNVSVKGLGHKDASIRQDPRGLYSNFGCPETVLHLAWENSKNFKSFSNLDQLPYHFNFLKGLVEQGLKHLVVAGTGFEYGLSSGPLKETDKTDPVTAYGLAKDTLRRELSLLKRERDFTLTWVRIFYIYGDCQAKTLYTLLKAGALRGDKTFPMSKGEQLRDFLPLEAVARGLGELALMKKDLGIVNLGSGVPRSVLGLVQDWIAQNHWDIRPEPGAYPYPDYEPMAFWADTTKLKSLGVNL